MIWRIELKLLVLLYIKTVQFMLKYNKAPAVNSFFYFVFFFFLFLQIMNITQTEPKHSTLQMIEEYVPST